MLNLDCQLEYWNNVGPTKPFGHPVNPDRLRQYITADSKVLDYGCGYGRTLGSLRDAGYCNLLGVDPALVMIATARKRFPTIPFQQIIDPPRVDLDSDSTDAVLLFSVLTCVPSNAGQQALIEEVSRLLRPGGLLYISDLWLQTDARNIERYKRDQQKYSTYGVFDLDEGVTVRHHDARWIEILTRDYQKLAMDDLEVQTMNGHTANAFQWFGVATRPARHLNESAF
jgi:SAM-dependent methyltransferase